MINLEEELLDDEGLSLKPYKDKLGNWTIGVGHLLPKGINYSGISLEAAGIFLARDIAQAKTDCVYRIPNFNKLNEARQYVLISMCFNMGIRKLLTFKRMLEALQIEDYTAAADEMLDSKWATQVPRRAKKLFKIMLEGKQ